MGNLIVSVIAALAASISVYDATASFLLALLTYSTAGSLTLLLILATAHFAPVEETQER